MKKTQWPFVANLTSSPPILYSKLNKSEVD